MLNLITGQPGNGKTLYTLGLVEKLRQETGRPVYQSGIPELTLPWESLSDPLLWPTLPNGSIVVIDECQRVFPPRKQGASVPPHVAEFETHRHRGFDIFLITQHPQLLDIAVRKLTGRHYHLKRTFGQEVATVYQWEEATDPNERGKRNLALQSRFSFPRERYGVYKSADMHTVKKEIPFKPFAVLGGSILGIIVLAWFAWSGLSSLGDDEQTTGQDVAASLEAAADQGRGYHLESASVLPVIPHWPWSAPFYRDRAQLVSVPRITGCLSIKIGQQHICKCSNGQGDAPVSTEVCRDFMAGKVFDPARPVIDAKADNIRRLDAAGAGPQPESSSPVLNRS